MIGSTRLVPNMCLEKCLCKWNVDSQQGQGSADILRNIARDAAAMVYQGRISECRV